MRVPARAGSRELRRPAGRPTAADAGRQPRRASASRTRPSTAGDITGPLVVGRVLDDRGRAAEERQDDQLVHRRRRPTPTAPASRRASSAAPTTSSSATSWSCVLPGAVLPGGLRDRRAQDLRPRLRRDDLLRARARPRRRPRRHHRARPPARRREGRHAEPGDDAIALLGLDEEAVEIESTPTAATASRCAASPASTGTPRAVTERRLPRPRRARGARPPPTDGYPVELRTSADRRLPGCDRYVARVVRGIDPTRADAARG